MQEKHVIDPLHTSFGGLKKGIMPALAGALTAGYANRNRVPKPLTTEIVGNAITNLSNNQLLNDPETLIRYMGGVLGTTDLPQLRTPTGFAQALGTVQGGAQDIINNQAAKDLGVYQAAF